MHDKPAIGEIENPVLRDTRRGVDRRLGTEVDPARGHTDLDDEPRLRGMRLAVADRHDRTIRLRLADRIDDVQRALRAHLKARGGRKRNQPQSAYPMSSAGRCRPTSSAA